MLWLAKALGWFGPHGSSAWKYSCVDSAGSGCCGLEILELQVQRDKLYITNWGEDLRTPIPGLWVRIFLLVVFGIVSRILDISCDIFGRYRCQYREYVWDISIPISCDISHDIDTIPHVNMKTTQCGEFVFLCSIVSISCDICWVDYQTVWCVCSFGSRSKPETKSSVYKLPAESASRPACCVLYWWVAWIHTRSTQGDAWEGNLSLNIFFLAIETKARSVMGKGEECVPCDPGYELRKGGSSTK